ncbi:MAG: tetratricopeptide repeat protein [Gammaproteobacteria bacterium]
MPSSNLPSTGAAPGADALPSFQARDGDDRRLLDQIRAKPDDSDLWYQLGNHFAKSDRLDDAEQAYREALKRGPNPHALNNLGLVQIRLGVQALKEARQQMPQNPAVRAETQRFVQLLLKSAL